MNQEKETGLIYREVQRFRQVWIWVVVSTLAGSMWYTAVRQLLLRRPFGGRAMPDILLVIFWFIFGIGLPTLFFFGGLVTEVRDDGIYICFFPFHWSFHRIAFTDVKQCEVRAYRPLAEYGGWGIRYGRVGKAYNVSGDRGVQIEFLNGKQLLIGSQRAEELWQVIQAKHSEQGALADENKPHFELYNKVDILSDVSETALITLRARVLETKKRNPVLEDDVAQECLNHLRSLLPVETQNRILNRKLSSVATRYIALRSRKYDSYAKTFIKDNPDGLVVSLGCGFDTRYWRVSKKDWRYVEVDLPPVIKAKKEILGNKLAYLVIGCSILEERWLEEILTIQNENVLFLAEGLFMYLPQQEVERIFKKLSESFSKSAIVFEVVTKKYTQGLWKKIVEAKMKRSLGTEAGSSYQFGVHNSSEIESYGEGIKVIEEWSYFEDEDITPRILMLFKDIPFLSRNQWTIKAMIG